MDASPNPSGRRKTVPTKETLTTRVNSLEDLTRVLVDSQIRTDARLVRIAEESDQRIDKLVIAIGELISRMPPSATA
jgi:hypothetical protein